MRTIFIGDFPRFVEIAHDARCDQHDQLRLANRAALLLESVAEERNISEKGYLIAGVVDLVLDQPSERERLAVLDLDRGLDATLLDGRRIDTSMTLLLATLETSCSILRKTRPLS